MKKLLALLLLLGIVGCASIAEQENAYRADTKTRELAKKTVYEKYNEDLIAPKAMAKPISGYGVAIAGNTRESQTIKYQSLANDQAIMKAVLVIQATNLELRHFQLVRIWIRVQWLSEISTANRTSIARDF